MTVLNALPFVPASLADASAGRHRDRLMKRHRAPAQAVLCLAVGLALPWSDAGAGGFALNEMSAASVGNAHAGAGAAAEDLSTIYFNPAGLTRLDGREFMAVGSAIQTSSKFRSDGAVTSTGAPLAGGNGGDAGGWAFVPTLYYAMDVNDRLRFGIGVQSPFGLKTDYDADWVGRYQALKSQLVSVNINPTIAWRVNRQLSVGAGLSAQYVDVELTRAIDLGSACVGALGPGPCVGGGFLPQARDGRAKVTGNDWGFGYNLGLLFEPNPQSRIGIAFRSKISHEVRGDIDFSLPAGLPAPLAASPSLTGTDARASVTLPESLSLGGAIDLDPRWSLLGDVTWTRWNRFEELRVSFDNGAPDNATPQHWRNTTRVAIAANYRYDERWKLRAGVAYDPTPVRSEFRNPRIPDDDRVWLSFGAQFKPTRTAVVDVGYAHLFVKDAPLDSAEPPLGGRVTGEYDNHVNILSVQYRQHF